MNLNTMSLTASEFVAMMEDSLRNLQEVFQTGDGTITREKRNTIVLQNKRLVMIANTQNNKFLGHTPDLEERFETMKGMIILALQKMKSLTIVD